MTDPMGKGDFDLLIYLIINKHQPFIYIYILYYIYICTTYMDPMGYDSTNIS